jgi:hypothetical protein
MVATAELEAPPAGRAGRFGQLVTRSGIWPRLIRNRVAPAPLEGFFGVRLLALL